MTYVLRVAVERPIYLPLSYRSDRKLRVGVRVKVPVGRSLARGWVISLDNLEEEGLKPISGVVDQVPPLPSNFLRLAELISQEYCYPLGLSLRMLFPYDYLSSFGEMGFKVDYPLFKKVVVGERKERIRLYRDLIASVLEKGGKVLLIVPQVEELSYWVEELSFKEKTFLWYAQMGRRERKLSWEVAKKDREALFVGTSSASFLPLRGLSLVIVEDEGNSYLRRVSKPYIHARDAILLRSRIESYSMVFGGPVPSSEAYELAVREGWELLNIPRRFKPTYKVIDLRKTKTKAFLSLSIFRKVKINSRSGRKSVLLLNRKAYASYLKCEECGYVPECPNCGIPLAFYREEGKVRCSYCGYELSVSDECPNCGGFSLRSGAPGVEQVELALRKELGKVFRWDAETREFDENALVIVGTQRVLQAKVMRNASLTCMVLADTLIYRSSYRGEEEALRVIYSLADFSPSEIYVQTYIPAHPVFKVFKDDSWKDFLENELTKRRELSYPPLSCVALVVAVGKSESLLRRKLDSVKDLFQDGEVEVLGPLKKGISGGKISLSLLLKGEKGKVQREIWKFISEGRLKLTRNFYVIVDPPEV